MLTEHQISAFIDFVRELYQSDNVPLHRPLFEGNEKIYLQNCIDSTFVSSVGAKVNDFESALSQFTGAEYVIATSNGTAALHAALTLAGVDENTEVITQALTFVGTCNPVKYLGASLIFIDVARDTLGLCPCALERYLLSHVTMKNGVATNKTTGKIIKVCVPMHTFGHPCAVEEIVEICDSYNIVVIEDAAESLGSFSTGKHTGTMGIAGVLSFNGNKVITTGGGGAIITNDEKFARQARHITTTAKVPHPYLFLHDEIGFNYRMPNLNAALGCAQMEKLSQMLAHKRVITNQYKQHFVNSHIQFFQEPEGARSNYWLNTILLENQQERDEFLEKTNAAGIETRPAWTLMPDLDIFALSEHDGLKNSIELASCIVNIPSSVPSEIQRNLQ